MNGIVLRVGDRVRPSSAAHGKRAGLDGSVPGSQDLFRTATEKYRGMGGSAVEREGAVIRFVWGLPCVSGCD
jgi:hypothetical protein